jgi:hypothetical protein
VAPILDLAVVALAVMVSLTLGLLAWTIGITIPRALRRTRADLVVARLAVAVAERRLRVLAERARGLQEGDAHTS